VAMAVVLRVLMRPMLATQGRQGKVVKVGRGDVGTYAAWVAAHPTRSSAAIVFTMRSGSMPWRAALSQP
jgi:hypothetical protein